MTITSTPSEIAYAGDGVSTVFTIPFAFDTTADLKVTKTDSSGNISVLTTGFSVSGGAGSTGSLTLTSALAVGYTLTILDDPERIQDADYVSNDAFPAESHEKALDHGVRLSKRLWQLVQRCIRTQDGDPITGAGMTLGTVDNRKGKYLFFNAVTGAIEYATAIIGSTLSQSIIGQFLNPQTDAEAAAGVTPTNYSYAPGPLLDARRYGVVADGVTDNATALANFSAVLKQTPGTIGVLPAGVINCSSLTAFPFNSTVGITLQSGSALNGTKLVYTGVGTGNFIDARSSFGFSLRYISVYHSNSGFTGNLISFGHDGSANDSQHGLLSRCSFGASSAIYTAVGIQLDQATLITVENCDFGALNKCISGQNSAGGSYSVAIRIRDCQFAGYGSYAIYYGGTGWKITGNNFQANKDGLVEVFAANASTPCDTFQFSANTVLDATGASVVLVMYGSAGMDISGNLVGCGGGGAVFLQANGIIQGLSMRANHIQQGNIGIQAANVAHVGWTINGNYFDTITTPVDHPEYVTGINLEGNTPDIQGRNFQQRIAVTYSASMTIDASKGNQFDIIAINGTAFTINAPTNPVNGQRITIRIVNGAGLALGAVTWNAIFKMSAWTQPAANFNRSIDFVYIGAFSLWYQVSQTGVDVPN